MKSMSSKLPKLSPVYGLAQNSFMVWSASLDNSSIPEKATMQRLVYVILVCLAPKHGKPTGSAHSGYKDLLQIVGFLSPHNRKAHLPKN